MKTCVYVLIFSCYVFYVVSVLWSCLLLGVLSNFVNDVVDVSAHTKVQAGQSYRSFRPTDKLAETGSGGGRPN